MTLLVIEDDPGVSEVVQLLLTREGYAVERAASVKEGLRCLEARKVDLVITDLKLPDGTGLDVIRSLHAADPALPIILMTSYSSMDSVIAALRAGAVDYIVKPFNNDEFIHAVGRALSERPAKGAGGGRPLAIEAYIREVIERFQDSYSEIELARMLGIGRKALWMRRRQWGLKRSKRKTVSL